MAKVGLDIPKVQECISTTKARKLMDQRENSAWSPHALRINGWRYSGMMDADLVTRAICAGFIKAPEECNQIEYRDPLKMFVRGVHLGGIMGGVGKPVAMSTGTFILYMLVAMLAGAFSFFLYKRSIKKEVYFNIREHVNAEVQAQMAQYRCLAG